MPDKVASHRNGISGAPFYVVLFENTVSPGDKRNMVGIVFEEKHHVAVLDVDELVKGNIEFAEGNSWRGDHFEKDLRRHIAEWHRKRTEELTKPSASK